MTTRIDGGPAFPGEYVRHPAGQIGNQIDITARSSGMNLRDWFAGQVISTCTGSMREQDLEKAFPRRTGISREEIMASQAYAIADAMLAERAKP